MKKFWDFLEDCGVLRFTGDRLALDLDILGGVDGAAVGAAKGSRKGSDMVIVMGKERKVKMQNTSRFAIEWLAKNDVRVPTKVRRRLYLRKDWRARVVVLGPRSAREHGAFTAASHLLLPRHSRWDRTIVAATRRRQRVGTIATVSHHRHRDLTSPTAKASLLIPPQRRTPLGKSMETNGEIQSIPELWRPP